MLRHRAIAAWASAALLVSLIAPVQAAGPAVTPLTLSDCGYADHWAAAYACDLQHQGITLKEPLDEAVTRAEFMTLLTTALGRTPSGTAPAEALPPGGFDPAYQADEPVSREDAITLLAWSLGGYEPPVEPRVLDFAKDASAISTYAKGPFAFTVAYGVVEGVPGGALDPKADLDRGAAAKLISLAVPEKLPAELDKVTILSYNDLHGHIIGDAKRRAGNDVGAERLTTAIMGQRLKNPNLLLLDVGDSFQGTPISNLAKGEPVNDWRNIVDVSAATMGNHEFDWTRETMLKLIGDAEFPVVSANIVKAGTTERPEWIKPSALLTVGDYKVGVIGITALQTKVTTLPANVADLEFVDPAPVIDEQAKALRAEGADLVVVMVHSTASPGSSDQAKVEGDVAEWFKGVHERVDAVVAGHSHELTAGYVTNAQAELVPVVQGGSHGRSLARIELYIDKSTRAVIRAVPYVFAPSQNLAAAPAVTDLIADWVAAIKPIESRPVGKLAKPMSRTTTDAGESVLGDFIADAMLTAAPGIQIAMVNGGGIRADLEPDAATGDVTWGQWYTIQPFGNTMVTVDMTGAQVKTALEQGVESYVRLLKNEAGGHRPLQVSGISFTWDYAKPYGERVSEVKLADGSPIGMETTYKVVVNNFMATGGDDFSLLAELQAQQLDLGVVDLDVTVNYFTALSAKGAITYDLQNRIQVLNFPAE